MCLFWIFGSIVLVTHTSGSATVVNEMLSLLADNVVRNRVQEKKNNNFFAIILDKTSDICNLEQVSLSFQFVSDNLDLTECFLRFYETSCTKAEQLYVIVTDILQRFSLPLEKCRGQCYKGTSNVSGKITGLQTRIREEEGRAVFVHCLAHNLNLVVQDSFNGVPCVRDALSLIRDSIRFIRDSPKRLAIFKDLQDENNAILTPFCPTRYSVQCACNRIGLLCKLFAV